MAEGYDPGDPVYQDALAQAAGLGKSLYGRFRQSLTGPLPGLGGAEQYPSSGEQLQSMRDFFMGTPPERQVTPPTEGVEAVPFLEDPVVQLTLAGAPYVQPYVREAAGIAKDVGLMFGGKPIGPFGYQGPLMRGASGRLGQLRGGFRAGEAGNLGPVPRHLETGEPLPESVVRNARGDLTLLHHGTNRVYPDFELAQAGSGAGGDLYGPGIYMTQSPSVAESYATMQWPTEAKDILRELRQVREAQAMYEDAATLPEAGFSPADITQRVQDLQAHGDRIQARLIRHMDQNPWLYEQPANIRPVYADIRKPFDIDADIAMPQRQVLAGAIEQRVPGIEDRTAKEWLQEYADFLRDKSQSWTGHDLYQSMTQTLGTKSEVNELLKEAGYDGITHIGGSVTGGPQHKVWIAFHPDQVYPAANVMGGR